jgi:hypothetical protein
MNSLVALCQEVSRQDNASLITEIPVKKMLKMAPRAAVCKIKFTVNQCYGLVIGDEGRVFNISLNNHLGGVVCSDLCFAVVIPLNPRIYW